MNKFGAQERNLRYRVCAGDGCTRHKTFMVVGIFWKAFFSSFLKKQLHCRQVCEQIYSPKVLSVPAYNTLSLKQGRNFKPLWHRWPDFWTRRFIVQTENLLRSTIGRNVLIVGQLGKGLLRSIITLNIQKYKFFIY